MGRTFCQTYVGHLGDFGVEPIGIKLGVEEYNRHGMCICVDRDIVTLRDSPDLDRKPFEKHLNELSARSSAVQAMLTQAKRS